MTTKQTVEIICPRGRKTKRRVYGNMPVTVRCSCGCRYEVTFTAEE